MSTTMPKAGQIDRKWYVIDAAGKPLGRVAAQAAVLLRGKHKVTFAPHVDCGDHVIIINCKDAVLTGGKAEKKYYYRHTVHRPPEGTRYDTLMKTKPELAMELAVKGMIPSNSIGRNAMTRLRAYAGSEHKHAARSPWNGTCKEELNDVRICTLFLWHRPPQEQRGPGAPVSGHRQNHHQRP